MDNPDIIEEILKNTGAAPAATEVKAPDETAPAAAVAEPAVLPEAEAVIAAPAAAVAAKAPDETAPAAAVAEPAVLPEAEAVIAAPAAAVAAKAPDETAPAAAVEVEAPVEPAGRSDVAPEAETPSGLRPQQGFGAAPFGPAAVPPRGAPPREAPPDGGSPRNVPRQALQQRKPKRWPWLLLGAAAGLVAGLLLGLWLGGMLGLFRAGRSDAQGVPIPTQVPAERGDVSESGRMPGDSLLDRVPQGNQAGTATVPSEVYQRNVNAVVGVYGETEEVDYWGYSSSGTVAGTGFILTEDGYILTNYHVVKGCEDLRVELYDEREFPATLVGFEAGTSDIALLKIEATGLQTVTLGDSDRTLVGEMVCAIGNPLGRLTHSLTVGYLSAKDRIVNSDGTALNMLQTDCVVNSGNSGGPLFNMSGEVIGITTAKYAGTTSSGTTIEGIGFAIPINDVKPLLDDLQSYGHVQGRPYLGITVRTELPDGDYPAGVYVSAVNAGSCAEKAGMKAGDVITMLNDVSVADYDSLTAALNTHRAGDQIRITVWRDGELLTLQGTLDERPPDPQVSETP